MNLVSKKLIKTKAGYAHWCEGCNELHEFIVRGAFVPTPFWSYDMFHEQPSFDPDMLIEHPRAADPSIIWRCHYRLSVGYVYYFEDCSHDLKGQSIELPDIPKALSGLS